MHAIARSINGLVIGTIKQAPGQRQSQLVCSLACSCHAQLLTRMQHLMQVERLRTLLAGRQPLKLKGKKRKAALMQHVPDGTRLKTAAADTRHVVPLSTA